MSRLTVDERLRHARKARGEEVAAIAQRIGVREALLQAIDEGRFADLPPGIYGRSAIRAYATALHLDAVEVLADCEPLLARIDDPIGALARLRGVKPSRRDVPVESRPAQPATMVTEPAAWKPLAAAAIDGVMIMALLLVVVAAAAVFCHTPLSGFGRNVAPAFAVMGVVLAGGYFLCFGGIGGATPGQRIVAMPPAADEDRSPSVHGVLTRTARCILRDATCIRALGDALGRVSAEWHARLHSPPTAT